MWCVQVVVKFLRKSGVLKDCWVHDRDMGLVAQEISLLARLNHPNIVMVSRSLYPFFFLSLFACFGPLLSHLTTHTL